MTPTHAAVAPEEKHRNSFYAISESSPVRLGLALALVLGCSGLVWQLATMQSSLKEYMAKEYVSREIFDLRMDQMERSLMDLKADVRSLRDSLSAPAVVPAK
jgi:hypothetical protein